MLYAGINSGSPGDREQAVSGHQMAGLGDGDCDAVERRGSLLVLALGTSFRHGQAEVAAGTDPPPHLPGSSLPSQPWAAAIGVRGSDG